MLFTKCILAKPSVCDGARISIMSRHTLCDGVTPDSRITSFHFHASILAPSASLVGSYYKRGIGWAEFERRYLLELKEERRIFSVTTLSRLALVFPITLLCIERTAEQCHRRLLAEECQRYQLNLKVEHR